MNDAQNIIGEARKAIDVHKNEPAVKKMDPPKAEFTPSKAPKADAETYAKTAAEIKTPDPFAGVGNFNKNNNNNNNNNNNFNNNNNNNNNKPAQNNNVQNAAQNQQNKPPQGNKSANFNFDMAELLKAAEEEAAKESE